MLGQVSGTLAVPELDHCRVYSKQLRKISPLFSVMFKQISQLTPNSLTGQQFPELTCHVDCVLTDEMAQ